jgi:hypothetical protein
MSVDGKPLEALVAYIEQLRLLPGLNLKTNRRVLNSDGVQIAEFDVEVSGQAGASKIHWLIECRDRPSEGAAPGSWIEQLVGRRAIFEFTQVTAVSTTGFSPGANQIAAQQNVELRTVKSLAPENFSWIVAHPIPQRAPKARLLGTCLNVRPGEDLEVATRLKSFLSTKNASHDILRSTSCGEVVSVQRVFEALLQSEDFNQFISSIQPGDGKKMANLTYRFPDDNSHYVVDVDGHQIRIWEFVFGSELWVEEKMLPIAQSKEYAVNKTGSVVSQMVSYEFQAWDRKLALEFHNLAETRQTHVRLRVLK